MCNIEDAVGRFDSDARLRVIGVESYRRYSGRVVNMHSCIENMVIVNALVERELERFILQAGRS